MDRHEEGRSLGPQATPTEATNNRHGPSLLDEFLMLLIMPFIGIALSAVVIVTNKGFHIMPTWEAWTYSGLWCVVIVVFAVAKLYAPSVSLRGAVLSLVATTTPFFALGVAGISAGPATTINAPAQLVSMVHGMELMLRFGPLALTVAIAPLILLGLYEEMKQSGGRHLSR